MTAMPALLLTILLVRVLDTNSVSGDVVYQSVVVKTFENETVVLPCYTDEGDPEIRVRWYKTGTLLADSKNPHLLLPSRARMHANNSLEIVNLHPNDTAEYTCEVIRGNLLNPMRQTHTIKVQYSPKLKTVPEDGFLEVKKGDFIDIGCVADGNPPAVIKWRKNGQHMAPLEQRSHIKFRATSHHLGGVYQCTASNGVGDDVTAYVRVIVKDAPEVSAVRSSVHTAVGLRAALAATVEYANPPVKTAWFRDGRIVRTDDRIVLIVLDNVHQLIIRSVRESDLGNYTFRAENSLGMADVSFKLSGLPNVATFKVEPHLNRATATSFCLIWEVDSYSTIIEYNLWIRPYDRMISTYEQDESGTEPTYYPPQHVYWRKIVVPGDSSDGPIHSASYTVTGLSPNTVYEAMVTSRNTFGWSTRSSILRFATESGTGRTPIASYDYTEMAPILEEDMEAHNMSQAQMFERLNEINNFAAQNIPGAILVFVALAAKFVL